MEQVKVEGETGTTPAPPLEEATPPGAEEVSPFRVKFEESERRRQGQDRLINQLQQDKERLLSALATGGNTQGLQTRIDSLEETLAELLDAQGVTGNEEETSLSHKERLAKRREEAKQNSLKEQKLLWEARVSSAWEDIVDQFQHQEVSIESLMQDKQFMALWDKGDLRGAKRRAYEMAATKAPSASTEAEETEEQRIERLAEEKTRQTLRARGLLKNEGGGGSVPKGPTTFTEEQINDPKFWRENKEAILKAQAEGKIKVR